MIKRVYVWRNENDWPISKSIMLELPLDSEVPKYLSTLDKIFQYSGALFKGLPLYVELEMECN